MKILTPSLPVACALLLLVVSACGGVAGQDNNNGSDSDSDFATVVPSPSPSPASTPEATPSSEVQFPADSYQLTGTIVDVDVGGDVNSIHIVEHPGDPTAGEQYIVSARPDTRIAAWAATGAEPRLYADLEVGMRVVVAVDGAIQESYPALAGASHIFTMRSETEGPLESEDVVMVTFEHSLFNGFAPNAPIPPGDAFYLSYSVAGGAPSQLYFCRGDLPAPVACDGDVATYEVRVEVSRGAELEYAVYRVLGTGSDREELVEQGREIIDADWETRSHYRYGARNPGGYD